MFVNAESGIAVKFPGKVTLFKLKQLAKTLFPSTLILFGNSISVIRLQFAKADVEISLIILFSSKVIFSK